LLLLLSLAHQQKAEGIKIKVSKNKNNDHDGISHGVKFSQKDDRIPALESNETGTPSLLCLLWLQ